MKNQKVKFIYQSDGKIKPIDGNYEIKAIPEPGVYGVKITQQSGGMLEYDIIPKDRIELPSSSDMLMESIMPLDYMEKFFSKKGSKFHSDIKMIHKMGILLRGPQGTGKSTIMTSLANRFIDKLNSRVFVVNNYDTLVFVLEFAKLMKTEENVHTIIIFDECEYTLRDYESAIKTLLDSSDSLHNNLILFASNYAHKIPKAISDRPSRILFSIPVDEIEDVNVVNAILTDMNSDLDEDWKLSKEKIDSLSKELKGEVLDEIKTEFISEVFSINMDTPKLNREGVPRKESEARSNHKALPVSIIESDIKEGIRIPHEAVKTLDQLFEKK